jgi:hypothetical protein
MSRLPPEIFAAGRGAPAPRMATDLAEFFPTVLRNDLFHRDGILFGFEFVAGLPVHWAVVDPGRHAMYMWRKQSLSYPRSALALGSSLFTNGPFTDYGDGSLIKSTIRFTADVFPRIRHVFTEWHKGAPQSDLAEIAARHFQAPAPLGYVIGAREGISETTVARPNIFYFGRHGLDFEDYVIDRGDPLHETEAVGGLFGGVSNYQPYTVNTFNRVGYWGLVPLGADRLLRQSGVESALSTYQVATGENCEGLLFTVAGWANTQRMSHLLSAVRVRDAVQIDGGDSLLMGSGTTLRQGTFMPEWKRLLQCWGVQFRHRLPGDNSNLN